MCKNIYFSFQIASDVLDCFNYIYRRNSNIIPSVLRHNLSFKFLWKIPYRCTLAKLCQVLWTFFANQEQSQSSDLGGDAGGLPPCRKFFNFRPFWMYIQGHSSQIFTKMEKIYGNFPLLEKKCSKAPFFFAFFLASFPTFSLYPFFLFFSFFPQTFIFCFSPPGGLYFGKYIPLTNYIDFWIEPTIRVRSKINSMLRVVLSILKTVSC